MGLAAATGGNALLTVAKAGQLYPEAVILRLYQPSNTSQTVMLFLAGYLQATRRTMVPNPGAAGDEGRKGDPHLRRALTTLSVTVRATK